MQLAQIINPVVNPYIGGNISPGINSNVRSIILGTIIKKYLSNFITLTFIAGGIIFLMMLILGSVEYIMSGGEKEKAGNASKRITTALVGIAILFSTFVVISIVQIVFGVNILTLDIPTI